MSEDLENCSRGLLAFLHHVVWTSLLFSYPERHHLAPALCSADSIFSATGVDSILPQSCSRLMLQLFHLLSTYLYPLYCSTLFRCLNSSCILWPYTPHPSLAHTFPKRIVDLPVVNHWCDNLYDPCRHKQIRHLCIFLHWCPFRTRIASPFLLSNVVDNN